MLLGIFNMLFGGMVVYPDYVAQQLKERYDKYLKWFGVVLLIWGGIGAVSAIVNVFLIGTDTFFWLFWFLGSVLALCLGVIYGHEIVRAHLLPNHKQFEAIVTKLIPYKRKIGIAAMAVGFIQLFL